MKTLSLLLALALPCLLLSQNETPHPLEGTWKMTRAKWNATGEPTPVKQDIYKIFTKDHYYFVYYDAEKFSGAGGGSYVAGETDFTETVAFFTWDSTAARTQQTFQWVIEGDTLHQSGMIMGTDQYDDYLIEEYYERVEHAPDPVTHPHAGVWEVEKATYGAVTRSAEETPWTVRKIFTPTFWYAAFYDATTGAFNGVGFGTYQLSGKEYVETINAYSWDQSAVGKTYTFQLDVQPNKLLQAGKIDTDKYQDYKIEEHFKRIE